MRHLTETEIRTARLLAEGCSRKAIARIEGISTSSVASRVNSLLFKTDSSKAIEAIHKLAKQAAIVLFVMVAALPVTDKQRRDTRHARRSFTTRYELRA